MNDSINLMFPENFSNRSVVTAICLIKRDVVPSCDLLHTIEAGHVAVGQIVRNNNIISRRNQFDSHMTADIPCTS